MKRKLAIVITHPIQYNAPWFKLLTERDKIEIKVFYSWGTDVLENKHDPGFGKVIQWDIPLLEGYEYEFLTNTAKDKGSHHFNGIINADAIQKIRNYDPDALLVFGWAFQSHLKILRYFKGKIPVYFRGDSTLMNEPNGFSVKKTARRLFLTWVYRYVDIALYVGTQNKAYFKKHGLKEDQLVFAPHAVDNDRFEEPHELFEKEAVNIRRTLGISDEAIVFLYAGKLEPVKNPFLLLDSFLLYNKPGTHLVIIGNGVMEKALKEKASGNPAIHFLPFKNQSEMPVAYRIGDVFVLTSFSETWALGVNEAMACSRAILLNDRCGCAADLIYNGDNGFIYKSKNKEDLVGIMGSMNDKAVLVDMGKRSGTIVKDFSFEKICQAVENLLS